MINVVLIDDHELVRTGFRMILEQQMDIQVCGEAGTAEEGLRLIRAAGGLAIVQQPDDAEVSVMPQSAIDIAGADHVVPLAAIASLLNRFGSSTL